MFNYIPYTCRYAAYLKSITVKQSVLESKCVIKNSCQALNQFLHYKPLNSDRQKDAVLFKEFYDCNKTKFLLISDGLVACIFGENVKKIFYNLIKLVALLDNNSNSNDN
ncbi:hypothetical protein GQX74_012560 [Glossina fuscipes]|nr:hypothetical protein GQX74_012560 [Glossina fuscipes]